MFPDPPQLHLFTIISVLIPNTNLLSLQQSLLPLTPQVLNYKNNTDTEVLRNRDGLWTCLLASLIIYMSMCMNSIYLQTNC